jgi:regulatory protein
MSQCTGIPFTSLAAGGLASLFMSFSDKPREPRAPRRARARVSLKMQAIGFLSRREHSRQELRTKLLDSLRKRAREDAALEAASEKAAQELAQALLEQPANGIDDAFAPRTPGLAPASARARATVSATASPPVPRRAGASRIGALASADEFDPGPGGDVEPHVASGLRPRPSPASIDCAALDTLTLGNGAALPARLRARLAAAAEVRAGDSLAPATSTDTGTGTVARAGVGEGEGPGSDDAPAGDELERTDPEAAVDQLLDWLVAHQYLSETRFVESRVNARSRKQGALRIKLELSRHGLALEPDQAATLRATEFARAQALWQRKFGAVATEARERAKQARFLASRGFAADVVRRIVGGLDED